MIDLDEEGARELEERAAKAALEFIRFTRQVGCNISVDSIHLELLTEKFAPMRELCDQLDEIEREEASDECPI